MTYTRINPQTGVREFSSCKKIKTSDGAWILNPSAEQISAEGWEEYIPPVIPPQPQTEPTEYDKVEAINRLLATDVVALDDESALQVIALFPTWTSVIGKEVHTGERYYYDEALWKVLQDHTTQESWTPRDTPALFVEVSVEEWPQIPEHIPSTAPWNAGDKGTWKGEHYICKTDGCVWTPDEYPAAWEKVTE